MSSMFWCPNPRKVCVALPLSVALSLFSVSSYVTTLTHKCHSSRVVSIVLFYSNHNKIHPTNDLSSLETEQGCKGWHLKRSTSTNQRYRKPERETMQPKSRFTDIIDTQRIRGCDTLSFDESLDATHLSSMVNERHTHITPHN